MKTFTIVPSGAFSLKESAEFGFGQRSGQPFDGVMRLAFCQDDLEDQAGVELRQDERGVHGQIVGGSEDVDAIEAQVARVLSLDADVPASPKWGAVTR